jgi:hypothetical protein
MRRGCGCVLRQMLGEVVDKFMENKNATCCNLNDRGAHGCTRSGFESCVAFLVRKHEFVRL